MTDDNWSAAALRYLDGDGPPPADAGERARADRLKAAFLTYAEQLVPPGPELDRAALARLALDSAQFRAQQAAAAGAGMKPGAHADGPAAGDAGHGGAAGEAVRKRSRPLARSAEALRSAAC